MRARVSALVAVLLLAAVPLVAAGPLVPVGPVDCPAAPIGPLPKQAVIGAECDTANIAVAFVNGAQVPLQAAIGDVLAGVGNSSIIVPTDRASELIGLLQASASQALASETVAANYAVDNIPPQGTVQQLAHATRVRDIPLTYTAEDCFLPALPVGVPGVPTCTEGFGHIAKACIAAARPDGATEVRCDPSVDGAFDWILSAADPQGTYGFYTILTDKAGNVEDDTLVDASIVFDQTPGLASASLDVRETDTSRTPLTVHLAANDPLFADGTSAGILRIDLQERVDNGDWVKVSTKGVDGCPASAKADVTVDVTTAGAYEFRAIAVDCANNVESDSGVDASLFVFTDHAAPSVTVSVPAWHASLNSTSATAAFTVTDAAKSSGLSSVTCHAQRGDAPERTAAVSLPSGAKNISDKDLVFTNTCALPLNSTEGLWTVWVSAKDHAGNEGNSSKVEIELDLTAPTFAAASASPSPFSAVAQGGTVVSLKIADNTLLAEKRSAGLDIAVLNGTGVAVRQLVVSGVQAYDKSFGYTWDGRDAAHALVPDGAYTVRVRAVDAAANVNTTDLAVTVDNTFAISLGTCTDVNAGGQIPFDLAETGTMTVAIRDASGTVVRHLVTDLAYGAGHNLASWDGADDSGRAVHGSFTAIVSGHDALGNKDSATCSIAA